MPSEPCEGRWTHMVCHACYAKFEPGRTPIRIDAAPCSFSCCRCGFIIVEFPIYYRGAPSGFRYCVTPPATAEEGEHGRTG